MVHLQTSKKFQVMIWFIFKNVFYLFFKFQNILTASLRARVKVYLFLMASLISFVQFLKIIIVKFMWSFKAVKIFFYRNLIYRSTRCSNFLHSKGSEFGKNCYCFFMQNWCQAAECFNPLNLTPLKRLTWILMEILKS